MQDIKLEVWKIWRTTESTTHDRINATLIHRMLMRWWEDGRAPNGANYGTVNERLREVATARLELALGLGLAG